MLLRDVLDLKLRQCSSANEKYEVVVNSYYFLKRLVSIDVLLTQRRAFEIISLLFEEIGIVP